MNAIETCRQNSVQVNFQYKIKVNQNCKSRLSQQFNCKQYWGHPNESQLPINSTVDNEYQIP